jgi:cobaltochelatase CobS
MVQQFKLREQYSKIPKGTVIEASKVDKNMVMFMHRGRKKIIPIQFLEDVSGQGSSTTTGFGALDPDSASGLSASMGFVDPDDAFQTPPPPPPPPKPKLKKNEFFLTDVTGGRLPTSGIDHVLTKNQDDVWTDTQLADIPEVDKEYVWNADLLESLWMAYKHNKKILLTGFPGTGKTSGAIQFAAWVRHPVMRFNGKDGVEASSFLGMIWATKDGMEWKDGMMPQGTREGYIVIMDEVMKIPAGIQMSLQTLYEDNGYLILDDKPGTHNDKKVIPHPLFRMILTDNAKGLGDNFAQLAATQMQDISTLDRYGITAEVPYLEEGLEIQMLKGKYPGMAESEITKLVRFANLVRNGYKQSQISLSISPRGLETICTLFTDIPEIRRCIEMTFKAKLAESDEIDAVNEMINTVY